MRKLWGLVYTSVFCILIFSAHAKTQHEQNLDLSSTFSISLPRELKATMGFLPSLNGFLFEGNANGKPYTIWVSRRSPDTIANHFSVESYWKENLKFTKTISEISEDLGCKQTQSYVFQCNRTTRSRNGGGRFSAESLFWNSKSDLVVVRITSNNSTQDAFRMLEKFHFKIIDRLPAGRAQ